MGKDNHNTSSDGKDTFKVTAVFEEIENALNKDGADIVKKVQGIFGFKVTNCDGKEGYWLVNAKDGKGSVKFNANDKADCTLTLSDENLFDLMIGKLNPQKAFMQGKLKITGNMGLAMKLKELQTAQLKAKL